MAPVQYQRNKLNIVQIQFDGGCSPNPGQKYGSYSISMNGAEAYAVQRLPFGYGTNNEAEFEALLESLHKSLELLSLAGWTPAIFSVYIVTDSTIVRNRINGSRKNKLNAGSDPERRMSALALKCLALLNQFKSFTIEWQPRESNVALFGH